MSTLDYVTVKTFAEELGVTRTYVSAILVRRPDFPKPVIALSQKTRFWERADWENWKRRRQSIAKGA